MTGDFEFEINEYLPLREVVYTSLRRAILKEQLRPGERLMENTIAQKLGVSRTPVREAMRMLSDDGLVDLIPRRGAKVAKISRKQMQDVLEIRLTLEILAVRKASELISEDKIKELREAELQFRRTADSGVLTNIADADEQFHDVLYGAADNPRLLSILRSLREQMYRFRFEYLKKDDILPILIREHSRIADAVAAHNTELAEKLIREHIGNQEAAIDAALESDEKRR